MKIVVINNMAIGNEYLKVNRESWNDRVGLHLASAFYDVPTFREGRNSLTEIELPLLGDVAGKKVLHLQCHFGQDSLSLARMGAHVTGVDFSEVAIEAGHNLAKEMGLPVQFICSDIYSLPEVLKEKFDIVFTSYGTIGWLPDLQQWASVIAGMMKPGSYFIMAEFHPVAWMFDETFSQFKYSYFNESAIEENFTGTYADKTAPIERKEISWNHSLGDVLGSLVHQGIEIIEFQEFPFSPWNCFKGMKEITPGRFTIEKININIPLVYALKGQMK